MKVKSGEFKYEICYKGNLVARVHTETAVAAVRNLYIKSQQKHLKVKEL